MNDEPTETIPQAQDGAPTTGHLVPPRRRRVRSALVTAGLLLLVTGVLGCLIVLAQPFAGASGGCGGG